MSGALGRAVWPSGSAGLKRESVDFRLLLLSESSSTESTMILLDLDFNDIFWIDFSG